MAQVRHGAQSIISRMPLAFCRRSVTSRSCVDVLRVRTRTAGRRGDRERAAVLLENSHGFSLRLGMRPLVDVLDAC